MSAQTARGVVALFFAVLAGGPSGCRSRDVRVTISASADNVTPDHERAIQANADTTARDVRALLPSLPQRLELVVTRGKDVIPETGENATTAQPALIEWTIDPDRDVFFLIRHHLRATLFHEMHHLVRGQQQRVVTLMDAVVSEGMATAFERDFGKANPPWGSALSDAEGIAWTRELLSQPPSAPRDVWLSRHPDGRRWIGMRTGTFIVDRAAKATGKTSAQLVSTSTEELLRLADVR